MSSILLTCRHKESLQESYLHALRQGGWERGFTLLAPGDPVPSMAGHAGLLITGGGDIHPGHWDPEEPVHAKAKVDEERDALEGPLVQEAWRLGIPILGICRGEQVLNVALGGSLVQDIPSRFGCPLERHRTKQDLAHPVHLEPASRLAALLDREVCEVNSHHHQAVDRVAPGFRPAAWHLETALEGVPLVEAVEAVDLDRWALGVQWHPEEMVDLEGDAGQDARAIFRAFVAAAACC
ncbi:MAG TPA: gamma-glutamyl-gamma-aminobutyrate hydrolase family protein [Holophaga sp.]|nr:gamma-glutamyl-gamma-aminobutyrate hydrolase family protein [Holophaga sp.]